MTPAQSQLVKDIIGSIASIPVHPIRPDEAEVGVIGGPNPGRIITAAEVRECRKIMEVIG